MANSDDKNNKFAKIAQIMEQGLPQIVELRKALSEESDRGCALLAVSYLDSELEHLLVETLVDDNNVISELTSHYGPLGTFSSRIDFSYSLGLIGPASRRDLHLLRKIRNEFGHSAKPISFKTQKIASRCRELTVTYLKRDAEARHRFTSTVFGIAARIYVAQLRAEHVQVLEKRVPTEEYKRDFRESLNHIANTILNQDE